MKSREEYQAYEEKKVVVLKAAVEFLKSANETLDQTNRALTCQKLELVKQQRMFLDKKAALERGGSPVSDELSVQLGKIKSDILNVENNIKSNKRFVSKYCQKIKEGNIAYGTSDMFQRMKDPLETHLAVQTLGELLNLSSTKTEMKRITGKLNIEDFEFYNKKSTQVSMVSACVIACAVLAVTIWLLIPPVGVAFLPNLLFNLLDITFLWIDGLFLEYFFHESMVYLLEPKNPPALSIEVSRELDEIELSLKDGKVVDAAGVSNIGVFGGVANPASSSLDDDSTQVKNPMGV